MVEKMSYSIRTAQQLAPPVFALRGSRDGDAGLLRALFVSCRQELAALNIDAGLRDVILDLQFRAQRSQYASTYPHARDRIVVVGGRDVGRMLTARDDHGIRLIDLCLFEDMRGRGIGTALLRELASEGDAAGLDTELSVWSENAAARRLYERVGYRVTGQKRGYLTMRRPFLRKGMTHG